MLYKTEKFKKPKYIGDPINAVKIFSEKESDEITQQSFNSYDEAYDLLEEIYSDVCCSDADYGDRPYYEIIKVEE